MQAPLPVIQFPFTPLQGVCREGPVKPFLPSGCCIGPLPSPFKVSVPLLDEGVGDHLETFAELLALMLVGSHLSAHWKREVAVGVPSFDGFFQVN